MLPRPRMWSQTQPPVNPDCWWNPAHLTCLTARTAPVYNCYMDERMQEPPSQAVAQAQQTGNAIPGTLRGLPRINYYPPVVVTLMASILIFLVLAILTTSSILRLLTRLQYMASCQQVSVVDLGLCGLVSIVLVCGTLYFAGVVIKGFRDLRSPVYYTRGTVVRGQGMGGRRSSNWLVVAPRYSGPDLPVASEVTDEQRAASPDRSLIFQPRFGPDPARRNTGTYNTYSTSGTYLPPDRISSLTRAVQGQEAQATLLFHVSNMPPGMLTDGEEVLLAHSRYLQHIFYVAHLRGGEWESFRNKALI